MPVKYAQCDLDLRRPRPRQGGVQRARDDLDLLSHGALSDPLSDGLVDPLVALTRPPLLRGPPNPNAEADGQPPPLGRGPATGKPPRPLLTDPFQARMVAEREQELSAMRAGTKPIPREPLRAMVEDPVFGKGANTYKGLKRPEDDLIDPNATGLQLTKQKSSYYKEKAKDKVKKLGRSNGTAPFFHHKPLPQRLGTTAATKGAVSGSVKGLDMLTETVPFFGPAIASARHSVSGMVALGQADTASNIANGSKDDITTHLAKGVESNATERAKVSGAKMVASAASTFSPIPFTGTAANAMISGTAKAREHSKSKARPTRLRAQTDTGALNELLKEDPSMTAAMLEYLTAEPGLGPKELDAAVLNDMNIAKTVHDKATSGTQQHLQSLPPHASSMAPISGTTDRMLMAKLHLELRDNLPMLRRLQNLEPDNHIPLSKVRNGKVTTARSNDDSVSGKIKGAGTSIGHAAQRSVTRLPLVKDTQGLRERSGHLDRGHTLKPSYVKARMKGEQHRQAQRKVMGNDLKQLNDAYTAPFYE